MKRRWILPLYAALALGVAGLGAYLAVTLFVEQAGEVAVPALTGLSLSEALDEVTSQELDLAVAAFEYSDAVPENHIVRQRPEAERVVRGGRSVAVVVSRGPERHPVPDVRGLSLEDARILLGEAGLEENVAVRIQRGTAGQVLAIGADLGRRLPRGTAVPLLLSSGPRPVRLRMQRLEGMGVEQALTALDGHGLRAARIEEVSLEDPSRRGKVVSQDPLPGFPIIQGEGVNLSVAGSAGGGALVRGIWVSRTLAPGFGRHHLQLQVAEGARLWTLVDRWLAAGETFQHWLLLRPGQQARLLIDGNTTPLAEDMHL